MQPSVCCYDDRKCPKLPLAPVDFSIQYLASHEAYGDLAINHMWLLTICCYCPYFSSLLQGLVYFQMSSNTYVKCDFYKLKIYFSAISFFWHAFKDYQFLRGRSSPYVNEKVVAINTVMKIVMTRCKACYLIYITTNAVSSVKQL